MMRSATANVDNSTTNLSPSSYLDLYIPNRLTHGYKVIEERHLQKARVKQVSLNVSDSCLLISGSVSNAQGAHCSSRGGIKVAAAAIPMTATHVARMAFDRFPRHPVCRSVLAVSHLSRPVARPRQYRSTHAEEHVRCLR